MHCIKCYLAGLLYVSDTIVIIAYSSAVVVFLLLAGLWFTAPKVDCGGPSYWLQASHVASHIDWPSRTLLTVRPAWQDAVLLRRMTTRPTALAYYRLHSKSLLRSIPVMVACNIIMVQNE